MKSIVVVHCLRYSAIHAVAFDKRQCGRLLDTAAVLVSVGNATSKKMSIWDKQQQKKKLASLLCIAALRHT